MKCVLRPKYRGSLAFYLFIGLVILASIGLFFVIKNLLPVIISAIVFSIIVFFGILLNRLFDMNKIIINNSREQENIVINFKAGIPLSIKYIVSLEAGQELFYKNEKLSSNVINLAEYSKNYFVCDEFAVVKDSIFCDKNGNRYFYNENMGTITTFNDIELELKSYKKGYIRELGDDEMFSRASKELLIPFKFVIKSVKDGVRENLNSSNTSLSIQ